MRVGVDGERYVGVAEARLDGLEVDPGTYQLLASLDYWFYSNTTLTSVTGWANVSLDACCTLMQT